MRAEILYVADCPNLNAARRQVERLLAEQEVHLSIDEVEVVGPEAAERLRFAGSPTIRIDGQDVDPSAPAAPAALACRRYYDEGRFSGIPSDDLVRAAISSALRRAGPE